MNNVQYNGQVEEETKKLVLGSLWEPGMRTENKQKKTTYNGNNSVFTDLGNSIAHDNIVATLLDALLLL